MPEANAQPGSAYLLSEIGIRDEAQRLRRQAALMLALELPALLDSVPRGGTFTDLGCGTGLLADTVAHARPDATVRGFDADEGAVDLSRRRFGDRANVAFACRRVEQGPPEGQPPADAVALRLVLMHLPGPVEALRSAAAWVRPGGVLHVLEGDDRAFRFRPEPAGIARILDLMQAVQERKGGSRRLGQDLAALMTAAGWAQVGVEERAPEPAFAAAAAGQVFLPVADFYLAEAQRLGEADADEAASLARGLRAAVEAGLHGVHAPIFHAWGRNSGGAAA